MTEAQESESDNAFRNRVLNEVLRSGDDYWSSNAHVAIGLELDRIGAKYGLIRVPLRFFSINGRTSAR
jgi:hypothetical protein